MLELPVRTSAAAALAWAGCAVAACAYALCTDLGPHRLWGCVAAAGYTAAAAVAYLPRRGPTATRVTASLAVAVAGAVLVPLLVLVATGRGQLEVSVVARSGARLLATGSPYVDGPAAVSEVNPYLPGMAVFGLLPGDPRWWTGAVFLGCAAGALGVNGLRSRGLWALVSCPLIALPLAVGGVDLPLAGLLALGLAQAARGRVTTAGLLLGAAACLKWTAWPALAPAVALLGTGSARLRLLGCGLAVPALVCGPVALRDPGAFWDNTVRFPFGGGDVASPAASPLPGRLLAAHVPGGTALALALLGLAALSLAGSLVLRPPRTGRAAADRLAAGLGVATALMPASRFGYLVVPLVLWALPRCADHPPRKREPACPSEAAAARSSSPMTSRRARAASRSSSTAS